MNVGCNVEIKFWAPLLLLSSQMGNLNFSTECLFQGNDEIKS